MLSFSLVFYYFVSEWISIKQSEMKNNTEQQNFNTCLSWKAGVSVTASQNITNQTFCEVHISEFKQMSHSRLSSSKVVIRRVWRMRLFNLVMWRCVCSFMFSLHRFLNSHSDHRTELKITFVICHLWIVMELVSLCQTIKTRVDVLAFSCRSNEKLNLYYYIFNSIIIIIIIILLLNIEK